MLWWTLRQLKSENGETRRRAAEKLGASKDPKAVEPLIGALKDSDNYVRRGAAEALGEIGDARAVEPLILALKDSDYDVRRRAAEALGKIGWEPKDDTQRALRAVALSKWEEATRLGVTAVEPLILALEDSNYNVRWGAAKALGRIGDARAVEPLILALKDSDYSVRWGAAEALGRIGDARAVEPLIVALEDSDHNVGLKAAEALVKMVAVGPLIDRLKNSHSDVQELAALALGRLGDSRGVSWLIRRCANPKCAYDTIVALTWLLEAPERIAAEDLRTIANLRNVVQWSWRDSCDSTHEWKVEESVDCSYVKQLARQELIRRELAAMRKANSRKR